VPATTGRGEALWKGRAASVGDFVAYIDGDLRDFSQHFVVDLRGPLLTDIAYVKGFCRRPLENGTIVETDGDGRVIELVACPLLNLYWPGSRAVGSCAGPDVGG
jgi:glucosyl-3-phosphoglycerate synthase